jgi:hypothetical protein
MSCTCWPRRSARSISIDQLRLTPLDETTWPDFTRLAERHNGVRGGCSNGSKNVHTPPAAGYWARPEEECAVRELLRRSLSACYVEPRRADLAVLIALAALLELAAGTGLAYVAGFSRVGAALGGFQWLWLIPLCGALAASFAGYYVAYQGIFRADDGPRLSGPQLRAVVAAGFAGLLDHGGGTLDKRALQAAGADPEEAKTRAAGLAGLEHGVLAICASGAAITVLVSGRAAPPASTALPWAILPVPGAVIGFWAAERYWDRFYRQAGWRGTLGIFLRSVHLVWQLFIHPRPWGSAVLGMVLFWAGDAFAVWAGLAAFGYRMDPAAFIVGFATGMVFTRRAGPLAGAGILALALPLTLWYSGAPLAVAVAGVFVYRMLVLWLPLPILAAFLPALRTMAQRRITQPEPAVTGLRRCP